ncbi:MAG: 2Fe-2S iron-sulfur cluster-binding protein [Bdellovibrionota bacterium]
MLKRVKTSKSVLFFFDEETGTWTELGFGAKEKSVLAVALKNKVALSHSCDGNASCGTCRIRVVSSEQPLEDRNDLEAEIAYDRGFAPDERLACQLPACAGMKIKIPASEET